MIFLLKVVKMKMTPLDRERLIRIYLPTAYDGRAVDCIYAQDGNCLFDDNGFGSWRMDEAVEKYYQKTGIMMMVVGIDNSEKRFFEYSPWKACKLVQENGINEGGEGKLYASFIAKTLKPYIDSNYKVKNNYLLGSSMGAFISVYTAVAYPMFKKVGVFSPAIWFNNASFFGFLKKANLDLKQGFYITVGTNEGYGDDPHNFNKIYPLYAKKLYDFLASKGLSNVSYRLIENGKHNEAAWSNELMGFFEWLNL